MTDKKTRRGPLPSGLAQGGLGGPQDELLEDGQEEVFSRSEVESGNIEHLAEAGGDRAFGREGLSPSAL